LGAIRLPNSVTSEARTYSSEPLEDHFRFWKAVVHGVAVIKFRVDTRCDNSTGGFEVKAEWIQQSSERER